MTKHCTSKEGKQQLIWRIIQVTACAEFLKESGLHTKRTYFQTSVIIIGGVHFVCMLCDSSAVVIDIICLGHIHLYDRWQQSPINLLDLCNILMNFQSWNWNKWAEERHFWPKLRVTVSCIRDNLLQVLNVVKHLILFLQKCMICMYHSDNKSKVFSFVPVSHHTIFHANNCISQNLIFPPHLSFFLIRITHPHCLFDVPHSM